jgi:hypothetical protein
MKPKLLRYDTPTLSFMTWNLQGFFPSVYTHKAVFHTKKPQKAENQSTTAEAGVAGGEVANSL